MGGLEIAGGILLLITSVLLIAFIVLQEGGKGGIGALGGDSESYIGKSGDRSRSATLLKLTKILTVVFVVLTLALNIIAVLSK